jgi:hypothetical protein
MKIKWIGLFIWTVNLGGIVIAAIRDDLNLIVMHGFFMILGVMLALSKEDA